MSEKERQDHWNLLADGLGLPRSKEDKDTHDGVDEMPEIEGANEIRYETAPEAVIGEPSETAGDEKSSDKEESPGADLEKGRSTSEKTVVEDRLKQDTSAPVSGGWDDLARELGIEGAKQNKVAPPADDATTPVEAGACEDGPAAPSETEPVEMDNAFLSDLSDTIDSLAEDKWHKLFETPEGVTDDVTESETEDAPKPRRKRRKRRRPSSSDTRKSDQPEVLENSFDDLAEEPADDLVEESTEPMTTIEDQAKKKKTKRRRPRRKKTDEKPDGEARKEIVAEPESSTDQDLRKKPVKTKTRGDGMSGKKEKDVQTSKSTQAKNSHRGIPDWQEAVGMIISGNMDARKKHTSNGTSRSRGGRGPKSRDKSK